MTERHASVAAAPGIGRPEFDPHARDFLADPYPFYARLRSANPAHRSPAGMWVLSRYADVRDAVRDPRLSSRPSRYSVHARGNAERFPAARLARYLLPFLDAPDHTRLRKLVARAISDAQAEDMRGRIASIVERLIAPGLARGEMDIVRELAMPLPVEVIAELLGIPESDRAQLKVWSANFFHIFSPLPPPDVYAALNQAVVEFSDYLVGLIDQRRRSPGDDAISRLIAARDNDDRLSEDELVATCILMFANGEESLINLIGNAFHSLLQHPAQMARLRAEPALMRNAVEELLRFDAPAQIVGRTALADLEIGGQRIGAGDPVFLLIGSANRDAAQFADPDRLDLGRNASGHLGFGGGPHACIGAGLARIEAQQAIAALLSTTRDIESLLSNPPRHDSAFVRGLASL
ncbi:MAG TPA: cytochrome P450, partial [Arenimonas sp.]|nr:cytochrome P450 [Arenimonas sp.]